MGKYSKLFGAVIVLGIFFTLKHLELVPLGLDAIMVDVIAVALTGLGVYSAPKNTE